MTVHEIADRLVSLCRAGQFDDAYQELFADDAISYEMEGIPDGVTKGKDALFAKSKVFAEDVEEMHEFAVTDPIVMGNHFSVGMMIDLTKKSTGRSREEEICVYEVQNGKIVSERFFYNMGG